MQRFTVHQFNRRFPDDDACLAYIVGLIYPDGITCRTCGRVTGHHKLAKRKAYSCQECGTHVYPLAGTIFEKSSTPLKSWFYAMYLLGSTRTGISAKQLERELGVTYKTAWRMFAQVRKLMAEDLDPFAGPVEADETYVGGKRPGRRGRGAAGKAVVQGIVQRKGKILASVVPNVKAATLIPNIEARVLPASMVYTDELASYNSLEKKGFAHERVHHAAQVYVRGSAHTNTIEGFWSLVKRGLDGVNHQVGHNKLQGYLDSYTFRWNHRDDERPMFEAIATRTAKVRDGQQGVYAPIG